VFEKKPTSLIREAESLEQENYADLWSVLSGSRDGLNIVEQKFYNIKSRDLNIIYFLYIPI